MKAMRSDWSILDGSMAHTMATDDGVVRRMFIRPWA
jgi:hypothetical protein